MVKTVAKKKTLPKYLELSNGKRLSTISTQLFSNSTKGFKFCDVLESGSQNAHKARA